MAAMTFRVSTATIHAALDCSVDIAALSAAGSDPDVWRNVSQELGCAAAVRTPGSKRNGKHDFKSFHNSITLVVPRLPGESSAVPARKQCAKVFSNGSLHVTGGRSVACCLEIARVVCRLVWLAGATERAPKVQSHRLQLLNVIAKVGGLDDRLLDLEGACAELNALQDSPMTGTYNKEIYAGLNIKVPVAGGRQVTVLLFASGNIIFTGLKARDEMDEAARAFLGFIVPRLPGLMLGA